MSEERHMATLSERAQITFKKKEVAAPVVPQGRMVTRASDGVIEARDPNGRLVAHYNPRTNETRDDRGELVGPGNRLARLLQLAEAAAKSRSRPGSR
jgi:hypothetical protein